MRTSCRGKGQSADAAHPVNATISPFHLAIQGIVLLLDKAVNATIERVTDETGVPSVAIVPATGLTDRVNPVMKPWSVRNGVNRSILVDKAPRVLDRNLKPVLGQSWFPLESLRTLLMSGGDRTVSLWSVA